MMTSNELVRVPVAVERSVNSRDRQRPDGANRGVRTPASQFRFQKQRDLYRSDLVFRRPGRSARSHPFG